VPENFLASGNTPTMHNILWMNAERFQSSSTSRSDRMENFKSSAWKFWKIGNKKYFLESSLVWRVIKFCGKCDSD
jgi:hypothetical protein